MTCAALSADVPALQRRRPPTPCTSLSCLPLTTARPSSTCVALTAELWRDGAGWVVRGHAVLYVRVMSVAAPLAAADTPAAQ